jgi:hypothetical protein
MLSRVYTKTHTDRLGREWSHERAVLVCDSCGSSHEKKINKEFWQRRTHFCKRACFSQAIRKGGVADAVRKKTCLERYGVEHPMLDPTLDYRKKRDRTCLKRYGSTVPTKSDTVKQKTKATVKQRFGTDYPMQNEDVKAKMIESLKQNDLQEITIRRLETMKKRNTFKSSRAEEKLCQLLIERFGTENVERQRRPEGTAWPIDFYIKSIDAWVQVDGVYWHGLVPTATTLAHANIIMYKQDVDRRQNEWFAERNMKLIRTTDKIVKSLTTLPDNLAELDHYSIHSLPQRSRPISIDDPGESMLVQAPMSSSQNQLLPEASCVATKSASTYSNEHSVG